ncbi:CotS family spore coat protein [Bacillus carboniphilus]
MDGETDLSQGHLEKVLEHYPFTIQNIRLKSSRSGRTIWEVETDAGTKILKQAEMKPSRMLFIADSHLHLQQNGLPITTLHQTNSGGYCIGAGDYAYVLYDKVEGQEMIYYNVDQLRLALEFAAKFQQASKGFNAIEGGKPRGRLGKWHKLYRWKLQELEGNKQIAQSFPGDAFSVMFLAHVDNMLERGKQALIDLDKPFYTDWVKQVIDEKSFCQQDFTFARLVEFNSEAFMKELHSVTYDLPVRDIRIILNKVMKKMSVWDHDLVIHMLQSYDAINPLTEDNYRVLWTDVSFPHLFCSIAHKYYLGQKTSWSDEKYIWALQNIIAVEESKEEFMQNFSDIVSEIKKNSGGKKNG